LRTVGVIALAVSSSCIDPRHANALAIGYGAFEPAAIELAVAKIGEVLRQTARTQRYQAAGENR
jgi:hypothetical protein